MQSSSQVVTTNKHRTFFTQVGCPSCRPTNSVKALKGKSITYHGLAHPELIWGLPNLSCPLKASASGYLGGRDAKALISPLMPVPHKQYC